MNPIEFVEKHGVVLEAARGPRPNLAEAIAGEAIRGSWWGHKKGHAIFRATRTVRDSEHILVCHLIDGKITYVHRRLWPALVRVAKYLDRRNLGAVHEEHAASGAHRTHIVPFPRWVPTDTVHLAENLSEEDARAQLGDWMNAYLRKFVSHSR